VTPARIAAAVAVLMTALLLQATVIGPVLQPAPASLPALLVAAVALVDGPGTGLTFGFVAGLVADLGSEHPAGVLALCWLGVGVACGALSSSLASIRRDAAIAALACGSAALVSQALIAAFAGNTDGIVEAIRLVVPATLLDALLALAVVPMVRVFLHSESLRAPRPVLLLDGGIE
jgi:cell shape-determining protein MreD